MNTDERAILKLMNDYCFLIDGGDLEGFAGLFSNGTWLLKGDPEGGDTGAAEVLATLQNIALYEGKTHTKHVMSNVEIEIDQAAHRAEAQCYITVYQAVPPDFPLQPIFIGHYHDQFSCTDGDWHFTLREISPDLVGDLSRHRLDL